MLRAGRASRAPAPRGRPVWHRPGPALARVRERRRARRASSPSPAWAVPAPRVGSDGEDPRRRPGAAPDRPERPRSRRNGSSLRCPGPGRGRGPLCWSAPAREPARRPGSSLPRRFRSSFASRHTASRRTRPAASGAEQPSSHIIVGLLSEQPRSGVPVDRPTEGPVEGPSASGLPQAARRSCADPRPASRCRAAHQQLASRTQGHPDQLRARSHPAAPDAGPPRVSPPHRTWTCPARP